MIQSREKVVKFVTEQLEHGNCYREKAGKWSYGHQNIRELLDFIYGCEPENEQQKLINKDEYRKN